MDYLNEDDFKDLDRFIEICTDKSAAIGDLDEVTNSINEMFEIPISSGIVYAGQLHFDSENDIEYYRQCIDQGILLNEDETSHYLHLLENQKNS